MTTAENEAYEAELADFQASSHELEQELELELQESEERHKESQLQINKLTAEVQAWKVCLFVFFFWRVFSQT